MKTLAEKCHYCGSEKMQHYCHCGVDPVLAEWERRDALRLNPPWMTRDAWRLLHIAMTMPMSRARDGNDALAMFCDEIELHGFESSRANVWEKQPVTFKPKSVLAYLRSGVPAHCMIGTLPMLRDAKE